ncbi:hypothetical protein LTX96_0004220 [Nakaseomyces glabratus]|nr:hypothetical protein LTX96_0004220 [Nakaseomyces glabratus]
MVPELTNTPASITSRDVASETVRAKSSVIVPVLVRDEGIMFIDCDPPRPKRLPLDIVIEPLLVTDEVLGMLKEKGNKISSKAVADREPPPSIVRRSLKAYELPNVNDNAPVENI